MDKLKEIMIQLDELDAATDSKRVSLVKRAQDLYNKCIFDKDAALQKAINDIDDSQEYGADDCGIYRWVRWNDPNGIVDDASIGYLQDYLQERGVDFDGLADALRYYNGPAIIINDDGDVYDEDSGKWVISKNDYNGDLVKRNLLIEQYMEKTGCFPGVFTISRYGDVRLVDTQAKKD